MDPLELLRQYTMQKKTMEFLDKEGNLTKDLLQAVTVRFGEDASFPRDTPTSYLRSNSESDQYTLSALLHFLDNRDQSFYEYMKTTNSLGLQTVSFGDRVNLLDYLTGKSSEIGASKSGGAATATEAGAGAGEKHGSSGAGSDGRRVRMRTSTTDILAEGADGGLRSSILADHRSSSGAAGTASATSGDAAREITRRERVLVTTSTALSSGKSFASVSELIKELFPSKQSAKSVSVTGSAVPATESGKPVGTASSRKSLHRKRRGPVIIVPAATTAMVNMYNIKQLLQDHQFVDCREVMEQGGSKPREVTVERTMLNTGSSQKFRIVDSVQDFTDADWNSIVCVFTQGAAWQFKNWMWKTPEEVFKHCLGFYPKYQDERLKETADSWGILPLNIERSRRHMDKATITGLWSHIEQYMARSKQDLLQ
ncbi:accessory factor associated with RNA polymerase II [Coemansia spiralis]|uniref:Accessory factor associated with RNA polymerase II n=2 Tax=Coemansia TaxID=4863 RepID=A0A9W8KYB4_9FUNG|nr:accessory factor associated with RNA polymerase II [Coemansia umbellata]KAJ2618498.1 accessory factor associated with RNA polymerase II [Coemansia sp. RSA 1358]KAJ2677478.1 accessory factor associated with RNA polymerase II [Coemansia spiralis]